MKESTQGHFTMTRMVPSSEISYFFSNLGDASKTGFKIFTETSSPISKWKSVQLGAEAVKIPKLNYIKDIT